MHADDLVLHAPSVYAMCHLLAIGYVTILRDILKKILLTLLNPKRVERKGPTP
jgi:hypothetical protein